MNDAQRIIAKFGGQTALASHLSTKQSTVHYWSKTGHIPAKWHAQIAKAAAECGISLSPGEFDPVSAAQEALAAPPVAHWHGLLPVADRRLPVYVLDDGRNSIALASAHDFLAVGSGRAKPESSLRLRLLQPFLPADIDEQFFDIAIGEDQVVHALSASAFIDICSAYSRARDAGALEAEWQVTAAVRASTVLAAFAKTGIEAAIHEVTGYQLERMADALRTKLKANIEEDLRPWEATFPDELWIQFGRLTRWEGPVGSRPQYWAGLVNDLIYGYLDTEVIRWLKANAPSDRRGQNYHKWIAGQFGLERLVQHVWTVIGMATACRDIAELRQRIAERFGREKVQFTLYLPPAGQGHRQPR
jgi:hypothetical protein